MNFEVNWHRRPVLRIHTTQRFSGCGTTLSLHITPWFYFTNHRYRGEKKWFIRVGKWPGWIKSFGPKEV